MKINYLDKYNVIEPQQNYSLYKIQDKPLYKDTYFFKQAFCPKDMTLDKAKTLFEQIKDSNIEELPERSIPPFC